MWNFTNLLRKNVNMYYLKYMSKVDDNLKIKKSDGLC